MTSFDAETDFGYIIIIIIVKGLTACALESQRSGVEFRLEGVNVRRVRCRGSAHECEG